MTKNEFLQNFKYYNFIVLKDKYIVNRKPLYITLLTEEEDNRIKFKNVDELLKYELDGESILSIITKLDTLGDMVLDGGRGASSASSGIQTFKFGHAASGNGKGKLPSASGNRKGKLPSAPNPLVAEANTRIKTKSQSSALKWFGDKYKNSGIEFAVEVDDNGFVHQHIRGNETSVNIKSSDRRRKGVRNTMIYHNHPSGSAFSDMDLLSTASDRNSRGIVAAGKKYNYIFKKRDGGKFKAAAFTKAVNNATLRGKDYNEAVHNWLKANQKKYGYTYKREEV